MGTDYKPSPLTEAVILGWLGLGVLCSTALVVVGLLALVRLFLS